MTDSPPERDLIADGIRLFNDGYFFEAHEVWEEAWRQERGEPRTFLQGLIQVAAGLHHLESGNRTGAASLFRKALDKLRRYPAEYLGIDAARLIADLEGARATVEGRAGPGDPEGTTRPRIRLSSAASSS